MQGIRNPSLAQIQSKVEWLQKRLKGREVVAAGGALRDIILGKPIKDLDFFITGGGPWEHFENLYEPLQREFAIGFHARDKIGNSFDLLSSKKSYGNNTSAAKAEDLTCEKAEVDYSNFYVIEYDVGWYGYPCQFVWINEGDVRKEVFEKFDFALARVWADHRRVRWSPEFASDAANKRLTLFNSGWGSTAPERVQRLRAKFSDYRFVNRSTQYLGDDRGAAKEV